MYSKANLLITHEEGKLIVKTFSLEDGTSNCWGISKLINFLSNSPSSETDVLKKINLFTLSFGEIVLVFHNIFECNAFFETYGVIISKYVFDVFDENGVKITREENFRKNLSKKNIKIDSSDQEINNKINQFVKEREVCY